MTVTRWHGSDEALKRLRQATDSNCTCNPENQMATCPAHGLLTDQNVLNHMAWVEYAREHGLFSEATDDQSPISFKPRQEAA